MPFGLNLIEGIRLLQCLQAHSRIPSEIRRFRAYRPFMMAGYIINSSNGRKPHFSGPLYSSRMVCHDNGDFHLVPFQSRSHRTERTPRMCQLNQRELT
jgi:hypothetical protein